ncbi:multicopper oxidase domain-containing protein [Alcaligenes aquatilis]
MLGYVKYLCSNETVRRAFRQELPGLRMFHCHILEHEDLSMAAQLRVE